MEQSTARITRVDPETTVAWEGDRISGTVELAPAGWGTKVVLRASALGGERTVAILADLGAAHHRPFSRERN